MYAIAWAFLLGFVVANWWRCVAEGPHLRIGRAGAPSVLRWHLWPRNRWLNLYLHRWLADDADPDLHDHAGWNVSLPFFPYWEEVFVADPQGWGVVSADLLLAFQGYSSPNLPPTRRVLRRAWLPVWRRATTAHRVVLERRYASTLAYSEGKGDPVTGWSLFLSGPKLRRWGFWTAAGWVDWEAYGAGAAGNYGARKGGM